MPGASTCICKATRKRCFLICEAGTVCRLGFDLVTRGVVVAHFLASIIPKNDHCAQREPLRTCGVADLRTELRCESMFRNAGAGKKSRKNLGGWLFACLVLLQSQFPSAAQDQTLLVDVVGARVRQSIDRRLVVELQFSEESRRAFAEATAANVRKFIEFRFEGELILRALLQTSITGGKVQVGDKLDEDGASKLASRLSRSTQVEVRFPRE